MNNPEQEPMIDNREQKIELTSDSIHSLDTIWRWASFFSVLGFLFIALIILLGVAIGFILSVFDNGTLGSSVKYLIMILYVIIGAVYFFPVLYLFRFSSWTKKAINNKSSLDFSLALKNLKSHFQYVGIMTLVLFGLYFLIIIGFVLATAFV